MKIITVSVRVRNAAQAARFYADVLELPVERKPDLVAVTVGSTRLELVEDPVADGILHIAITIPTNKFMEAKRWIQQHVNLLGTADADEFEGPPTWNAHSLYFAGPDRSVLEFIVRRDLANATPGPFTSTDLLRVSEVGIAVPGVLAAVAWLNGDAEIASYGDSFDSFAPVGDADGLLILVAPGRAWFPTADQVARESPIAITAEGGRPGSYALGTMGSLTVLPKV